MKEKIYNSELKVTYKMELGPKHRTFGDIQDFARKIFTPETIGLQEKMIAIYYNDLHLIGWKEIASGSQGKVVFDQKMIVGIAVKTMAKGVTLIHNHTNDVVTPSKEDLWAAEIAGRNLGLLGIALYDFVILTMKQDFSFKANGILKNYHAVHPSMWGKKAV